MWFLMCYTVCDTKVGILPSCSENGSILSFFLSNTALCTLKHIGLLIQTDRLYSPDGFAVI